MNARSFILATAGHVDHGKSALVRALTGIDPDRLPEEKARGITIDLGFAHLSLHSGDREHRVAIIDVPGHEDFVKNMVAGVGSIDAALLVVAADDGWMPQTEEHLQILTYLGVTRAVVALTKIDLATDEKRSIDEIRERLKDSPLAASRIVPVSTVKNLGIEALKNAIRETLDDTPAAPDFGKPRLPLDRVFTLKGLGTIVTGTLTGGSLRHGQSVVIQPSGQTSRVRSMQSHGRDVESALPGTRVALNLPEAVVQRGDVVTNAATGLPTEVFDARIERSNHSIDSLLARRKVRSGTRVRVHHGSTSSAARVQFLDADELKHGERAIARVRLEQPLLVAIGDRFIIRDWPEQHTLAGGIVLDPGARRQVSRPLLERRAKSLELSVLILTEVQRAGVIPRDGLLARSRHSEDAIAAALAEIIVTGEIVSAGAMLIDQARWRELIDAASRAIDAVHREHPERAGITLVELRTAIERFLPRTENLFGALMESLGRGEFVRSGATIRRSSHRPALPPRLRAAGEALRAALAKNALDPPSKNQLAPDAIAQQALKFLVINGEAIEVSSEIVLGSEAFHRAIEIVRAHLLRTGSAIVSDLKTALGSSRRIVVPLLEKLDREGITRRDGDRRSLRSASASP